MKRKYIVIVFVACVLVSFFITRSVLNRASESEFESSSPVVNPQTEPKSQTHIELVPKSESKKMSDSSAQPESKKASESSAQPESKKASESSAQLESKKASESNVQPESKKTSESEKKHVNITLSDVEQLILTGKYDKDRRISRKYKIEYDDVSEDDIESNGLQYNLTFVQERVELGEEGDPQWRGIKVDSIDFDNNGRVNYIKIRPIY